ncbi:MAG: lysophospholipase [Flavobacteriaceae bacterium]|nr:lysophospholipase [Flavobacteriaceae bacterium]
MNTQKTAHFTYQNTEFHWSSWEAKDAKAVVVLVHGMGSHSGRYTKSLIPFLLKNGYNVVAFDHFGHGKTEGKRGHNPGFEYVLGSVEKTIEKAVETFPNLPVFLYGHSMGGNTVTNFALRKKSLIKGFIVTSPMLEVAIEVPAWKLFLAKIMLKIAPSLTMPTGLNAQHISRIESEVERYKTDPLCHDKISPNFSIVFMEAGKWAIENANKLEKPMLLLHGTGDKICDYKGSEKFAKGNELVTLKLYKDAYHELHHDLCSEEMLEDVKQWLDEQVEK